LDIYQAVKYEKYIMNSIAISFNSQLQ